MDLLEINAKCQRINLEEVIELTRNKSKTIWLATTHKEVNSLNQINRDILLKTNNLTIDVIAKHTSSKSIIDLEKSKHLFKITHRSFKTKNKKDKRHHFPDPILSLSIGTRVKVIGNLATEIGNILILFLLISYFYCINYLIIRYL